VCCVSVMCDVWGTQHTSVPHTSHITLTQHVMCDVWGTLVCCVSVMCDVWGTLVCCVSVMCDVWGTLVCHGSDVGIVVHVNRLEVCQ